MPDHRRLDRIVTATGAMEDSFARYLDGVSSGGHRRFSQIADPKTGRMSDAFARFLDQFGGGHRRISRMVEPSGRMSDAFARFLDTI